MSDDCLNNQFAPKSHSNLSERRHQYLNLVWTYWIYRIACWGYEH